MEICCLEYSIRWSTLCRRIKLLFHLTNRAAHLSQGKSAEMVAMRINKTLPKQARMTPVYRHLKTNQDNRTEPKCCTLNDRSLTALTIYTVNIFVVCVVCKSYFIQREPLSPPVCCRSSALGEVSLSYISHVT